MNLSATRPRAGLREGRVVQVPAAYSEFGAVPGDVHGFSRYVHDAYGGDRRVRAERP